MLTLLFKSARKRAKTGERDPIDHPDIARMDLRMLADLPLPRQAPAEKPVECS